MSPVDLKLERLKRLDDNKDCSPEDLFVLINDFLKDWPHAHQMTRVMVMIEADAGTHKVVEFFRAGCTRYEELALIALWQAHLLQVWRNS